MPYTKHNPKVVIFVVTYNRLEVLAQTLESYKRFTVDYDIVIVNNGTDNPKCVALLNETGYTVFNTSKVYSMEELEQNITSVVKDYYDKYDTPYFAVSDCDCCFDIVKPNTIEVYIELCEKYNCAVGAHYVVDDIPVNYPLRSRAIVTESRMLYKSRMTHHRDDIFFSNDEIDTTFVLFPRCPEFKRLRMSTIRVLMPYAARHLDWYIDVFNPTEGNLIYVNKESTVGSFGGAWLRGFLAKITKSKEETFNYYLNSEKISNDYCLNSFFLSWMYQFGHGTPVNIEKAKEWLVKGSPDVGEKEYNPRYRMNDIIEMIINNNYSCLNG